MNIGLMVICSMLGFIIGIVATTWLIEICLKRGLMLSGISKYLANYEFKKEYIKEKYRGKAR